MMDFRDNTLYSVYVHIVPKIISKYDHDKYYVGVTKLKPHRRWRDGKGYIKNDHFYRAIQKYGWNNIEHHVIANNLTSYEAFNMEKFLIKELDSNNPLNGYNKSSGGECGNNGVCKTEKQISIFKTTCVAYWQNPEHLKQQSERISKLWANEEYRKERLKSVLKGKDSPTAKKVVCLDTLNIYDSIREAAKDTECSGVTIGKCCMHTRKSTHNKDGKIFHWMYYDEYIKLNRNEISAMLEKLKVRKQNSRSKYVLNIENLTVFKSQADAGRYYEIPNSCNIGDSIRKGTKCKGFHWQLLDNYLEENNMSLEEAREILHFIEQ